MRRALLAERGYNYLKTRTFYVHHKRTLRHRPQPSPTTTQLLLLTSSKPVNDTASVVGMQGLSNFIHTAFPQFRLRSPSDASRTLCRTTATKMTSIKKTTVVRVAASSPSPSVMSEGSREVPLDPRRRMNNDVKNARNVRPAAGLNVSIIVMEPINQIYTNWVKHESSRCGA